MHFAHWATRAAVPLRSRQLKTDKAGWKVSGQFSLPSLPQNPLQPSCGILPYGSVVAEVPPLQSATFGWRFSCECQQLLT